MTQQARKLAIEVVDIQGRCPVYRVSDCFYIEEGYKLVSDRPMCMHALQSLGPYYVPLSRGIDPVALGLAGPNEAPEEAAYVQCLDPQHYTGGGTVIFRITLEGESLSNISKNDKPEAVTNFRPGS